MNTNFHKSDDSFLEEIAALQNPNSTLASCGSTMYSHEMSEEENNDQDGNGEDHDDDDDYSRLIMESLEIATIANDDSTGDASLSDISELSEHMSTKHEYPSSFFQEKAPTQSFEYSQFPSKQRPKFNFEYRSEVVFPTSVYKSDPRAQAMTDDKRSKHEDLETNCKQERQRLSFLMQRSDMSREAMLQLRAPRHRQRGRDGVPPTIVDATPSGN
jgi:hypothetical protein